MKGNVFTLKRSSDYLLRRAGENRRAGRYGEAMTLLRLAETQAREPDRRILWEQSELLADVRLYEASSEILYELLQTGGESEEGMCFYALGENAYAAGNMRRAYEYLTLFLDGDCADETYNHALDLVEGAQEAEGEGAEGEDAAEAPTRTAYVRRLTQRALRRMQEGKQKSAIRQLQRALVLEPGADIYGMLALNAFKHQAYDRAVGYCRRALLDTPKSVHRLCMLASIYRAKGEKNQAHAALLRAMAAAQTTEDDLSIGQCASEFALDGVVQLHCGRILKTQPYHAEAAHLYAIACMNTGRVRRAAQVWGRMTRMLAGDTVMGYYDHLAQEHMKAGTRPKRLVYTKQVPVEEFRRRMEEISEFFIETETEEMRERFERDASFRALMRWLLYLPSSHGSTTRAAMAMMARIGGERVRRMILTMLLDEAHSDGQKQEALALLSSIGYEEPCFVYMGGTLARAVPQQIAHTPIPDGGDRVVQQAIECMDLEDERAVKTLVSIWLQYLTGNRQRRLTHEAVWPLALEWAYGRLTGGNVTAKKIARREGVSSRLIKRLGRKIIAAQKGGEQE